MGRSLPLWLFLSCLLLGTLFMLTFGWVVKSTVEDYEYNASFGRVGEASLAIASFPDTVRHAFEDIFADPDKYLRVPRTHANLSSFQPIPMKSDIRVQGLLVRTNRPALKRSPGWRILVGNFVVDGELQHAALALSPEMEVVNAWVLREDDIQGQRPQPANHKIIHGFALLKDGSMIFAWAGGVSIQRFDTCGRKIWSVGGNFHHAIALSEDERFVWTLRRSSTSDNEAMDEVVQLTTATGEVVRHFSMANVVKANPTIDVLEIRQRDDNWLNGNPRNTAERWQPDALHLNDVEPLPEKLADRFPNFKAGDLLLSARSLNLIFVLEPKTLEVKWWHSGAWRRQHDPDWQPTGEITVHDNRFGRDYSRIVSIAPATRTTTAVFDGRSIDWYSRIRGNHQITNAGNILVASPQQGRVFEIDRDGQLVFDMFNTKPGSKEFNYFIADAIWLPTETIDLARSLSCID